MTNTITLQNAKKLKEVKYRVELPDDEWCDKQYENGKQFNLYTTTELLERLPIEIRNSLRWIGNEESPYALELSGEYEKITVFAKTPADALCLLAIELIKKRIIK